MDLRPNDDEAYRHAHAFVADTSHAERRTWFVVIITAAMMVVEILTGHLFQSMSLLADGWHMSTHVAAFAITLVAYYYGRRHAADPSYTFGTGKMGALGGFASAIFLLGVAFFMGRESVERLFSARSIQFNEALVVAVIGLLINMVCAWLLKDDHHHHHGDAHDHHHSHAQGEDLNRRAAYLHVLADALTSVGAIVALLAAKFLGWSWLDALIGLVGGVVVAIWAVGLLRETSGILLDRVPASSDLPQVIREGIESDQDARVTDLHIWQVAQGRFAAIVALVADNPRPVAEYRNRLQMHEELVHISLEVHRRGQGVPSAQVLLGSS